LQNLVLPSESAQSIKITIVATKVDRAVCDRG
jgi:hypothetical protein